MGHGSLLNGQLLSLKQVSFYFYITNSYKEVCVVFFSVTVLGVA